tara:strand:- start:675 stop:1013 length:339 start_codon:yes stop_codon:yes gene_type:complete
MSLSKRPPSAGRTTFQRWAERLNDWLVYTRSRLAFFQTGDTPTEDGIILWDQEGYPVVSKTNKWYRVVISDDSIQFPAQADPPSAPVNGMVYYDTDDNKLKLYASGAWVDLN